MPLGFSLAACSEPDDAVLLEVRFDDVQVGSEANSFCLGIWDGSPSGGSFGQSYALSVSEGQTLSVDPGKAKSARVALRLLDRGLPVNRAHVDLDFSEDSSVSVETCPIGASAAATERASAEVDVDSLLAVSEGEASWIVVIGSTSAKAFQSVGDELVELALTLPPPTVELRRIVVVDVEGDCDDDLLLVAADGMHLWIRERDGFRAADELLPTTGLQRRDGVAFDFNGDLFADLAFVGAGGLNVWQGGAGGFVDVDDPAPGVDLSLANEVDIGDLDGDGQLDLVLARGAPESPLPDRVLYGQGDGTFLADEDAFQAIESVTTEIAILDVDGDGIGEILTGGPAQAVRAYQRGDDGTYDDRSFVLLPTNEPIDAVDFAVSDWTGDCLKDLVIAATETQSWVRVGNALKIEEPLGAARTTTIADLIGDGGRDLLTLDEGTMRWWSRR